MEGILDWGIDVILGLRQIAPGLVTPFEILTFLGNEMFFFLLIPFVYWCLDRRTGARFTVLFLISAYLNLIAKWVANQPRPFDYAPERMAPLFVDSHGQAQDRYEASGGGMPSGHTQNSVVIWGYLALRFRRSWLWVLAGLLVILVPLSRIYLGVHFPHDVLGGYLLGAVLLPLYLWLAPKAEAKIAGIHLGWQLGIVLVISALTMILVTEETSVTAGASLMGIGTGFVLERRWVGFESTGKWWQRGLCYVLGIAVLFGLYAGLKAAFDGLEPALFFRFVRYGLIGFWSGLGAPWVFVKLHLADGR